jgi:predicted transcriptional regulator
MTISCSQFQHWQNLLPGERRNGMIIPELQQFLLKNREHYLIPADVVANVSVDNRLGHAFLVLTKVRYAKIPVLDNDNHFFGFISLAMITDKMLALDHVSLAPLDQLKVADVMEKAADEAVVDDILDVEKILHLLVDNPFIPVVDDDNIFQGIITRREYMKSFNELVHNLNREYDLVPVRHPVHHS